MPAWVVSLVELLGEKVFALIFAKGLDGAPLSPEQLERVRDVAENWFSLTDAEQERERGLWNA